MTFRIKADQKSKLENLANIEKTTVSDMILDSVEKREQFETMELKIQAMASRIAALEQTKKIPRKRRISVGFTDEEYVKLEQACWNSYCIGDPTKGRSSDSLTK